VGVCVDVSVCKGVCMCDFTTQIQNKAIKIIFKIRIDPGTQLTTLSEAYCPRSKVTSPYIFT